MKRIPRWFVVLALAALFCQTGWAAEKTTAQDWFQMGMESERSGVHEEAVRLYTEAIKADKYYAEAYLHRGMASISFNKSYAMEALQDFNRAVELDPKNAEAYYQRGLLNAMIINNEDARGDMRAAASLGHKGAQQWLAPKRRADKEAEGLRVTAEAAPVAREVEPAPTPSGQPTGETADVFFAPGKPLPSGSEPVIRFDHDRAEIKEQFHLVLDEVARILKEKAPEARVLLAGHTDSTGTEKYNDGLSVRRARAVASYLSSEGGIPTNRLLIKGYGESAPIATNDTAEGRAKNRRVEIRAAEEADEPPAAGEQPSRAEAEPGSASGNGDQK